MSADLIRVLRDSELKPEQIEAKQNTGVITFVFNTNYDAVAYKLVGRLDAPVALASVGEDHVDIGTTLVERGVENIARWKR